ARLLWARVIEACGASPKPLRLHAESSWRMLARRDPHVNLLRATAATFAAATAGADTLTVLPFTAAIGLPDRFARRMARNVQLVLAEESNLGYVADPAAGSGFIDSLTRDLAEEAWAQFQRHEAAGGIVEALKAGSLTAQVDETRTARLRNVSRRKDALTGVSEFPNIHEAPAEVLAPAAVANGSGGFQPMRLSEPFEALRDAADAMGDRPSVFLANLGLAADFTVRSTWAANLFEAGGIEAPQNDGFAGLEEVVSAFNASGSEIAVLCSSDAVYTEEAAGAAQALSGAGAKHVYLAGRPDDQLSAAGIGTFVYAGCDILAVLQETHRMLGVST
ncbi:MAG: methylmalonyl-CoA mutase family protein, partial [Pseudomonadota bacterium]